MKLLAACAASFLLVLVAPKPARCFTDAEYAEHLSALKKSRPLEGFTIVIEPPFIVIGDDAEPAVRAIAGRTIAWAVRMLKQDYFEYDPPAIIDIWLFKDESSYVNNARAIFGSEPVSPFGYYLAPEKALVMNIATGGGTLVHEMVHPFIDANFPDCPAWFNEGLASLYEQCGEKDGRITGYTNWRLAGLQEAIRSGQVPSFEHLTALDGAAFYTEDKGTNYGQARYLCYYLQEKGLLVKYYRAFLKNRRADPTGYETLKSVLKTKDMKNFKKKWEGFVLKLAFPQPVVGE